MGSVLCRTGIQENEGSVACEAPGTPSSRLLQLPLGTSWSLCPDGGEAWRGVAAPDHARNLPGSEASRLGPRRRVQSLPWLGRFLSVHLLQDRVQLTDHVCLGA